MPALLSMFSLAALIGCSNSQPAPTAGATAAPAVAAAPAPPPKPAAPKSDAEKTVLDIALGSADHTTLVAAVKATDLAPALGSPGGIYTVFAPTNAAFDKLPAGTLDSLLKPEKKADLKKIVQHHAAVPVMTIKDLKDGQVIGMSDGTSVTVHLKDGKVMIDDANVIASVQGMNGVVHVVDAVLLPPAK
ncbi:MAG: fasciclin domain-containing protein [Pseudomonadota bacterium]|nr:fasciclin domain-containing protein [Pseudomonadota bacterium]